MISRPQKNFNTFLKEQFDAIKLLYDRRYVTPYLTILYSTIDILGHITGLEFDGFVKKYMLPTLPKNISAADLWGARCAILHTNSPESKHSKEKKARQISYTWGIANKSLAKEVVDKSGKGQQYTYISLEELKYSLSDGVISLQLDFSEKPGFWKASVQRIEKFYARIDLPVRQPESAS